MPGVVLREPLPGRPGTWRGTVNGARRVDVTVLRLGPDPAVRQAALAALGPLAGPAGAHRPAVERPVACRAGVAVIADAVDGKPAAGLPPLSAGSVVTLGLPLAQTFAGLHAMGRAYGATPSILSAEVLIDGTGRPWLPVHGLAGRRVAGAASDAGADVAALLAWLADRSGADVSAHSRGRQRSARRLAALLAAPPVDAAALVRGLRRVGRPRPLPTTESVAARPAGGPSRASRAGRSSRARRSLPVRPVLLGALFAAAVCGVAVLGWVTAGTGSAGSGSPRPAPLLPTGAPARSEGGAAQRSAEPTDWRAVLSGLDRARASAFDGAGPLTAADVSGSPAWHVDAASVAALQARRLHADGPVPRLQQVRLLRLHTSSATLAVTDVLPAYHYLDVADRVQATAPPRGAARWTITLRRVDGGWRVEQVGPG